MSFYYLSKEMGLALNNILGKACSYNKDFSREDIAITWINYKSDNKSVYKGFGAGINNKKMVYPASIVKLVYSLAAYYWVKKGSLFLSDELNDAVSKMLSFSSNNATSFLIDLLTGTTSGPCIEGELWENWKYQRNIINDWLHDLKWEELRGINCCQKTWDDGPFGREKEFYGHDNKNRNAMNSDSAARVLEEIMIHINYKKNDLNLRSFLKRNLNKVVLTNDSLNQIDGFLGEGLPENINLWSKAGLMSEVRHDSAWWTNSQSLHTLLVVFCNGEKYAKDTSFLPLIAKEVYEFNKSYKIKG
ncbi:serine hydrolase [Prochlorococcus marinus XMU1406]|uniref:serine hydrolase n=1 Tax=Prochlorococcus marinus TaxID=1219 RepID=UPI001ADCD9E2|nr:serine hydrolase [Prochlorococcus marinus]MBO8207102.1 serine hydrolase [Prochlorococcus marinus XMU1406]MCR8542918.1 class A beta-lactamase-related serine hydrolase [Prochlorococcus marinus XMU1427]